MNSVLNLGAIEINWTLLVVEAPYLSCQEPNQHFATSLVLTWEPEYILMPRGEPAGNRILLSTHP